MKSTMKRKMRAFDEPVYDSEWAENYGTTCYWSPCDIIDNSPWNEKEPYYEDGWEMALAAAMVLSMTRGSPA